MCVKSPPWVAKFIQPNTPHMHFGCTAAFYSFSFPGASSGEYFSSSHRKVYARNFISLVRSALMEKFQSAKSIFACVCFVGVCCCVVRVPHTCCVYVCVAGVIALRRWRSIFAALLNNKAARALGNYHYYLTVKWMDVIFITFCLPPFSLCFWLL